MLLELKLPKSTEIDEIIEKADIEEMGYDNRWGNYRLRLSEGDIEKHSDVLKELLIKAESNFNG
jgi:hypothetical protein